MKVYINNRKVSDKYEKAMTVYSDDGKLLYSAVSQIREEGLMKFDRALIAIEWGIRQFRLLCQNGVMSEQENVLLFLNSKTIYEWLDRENSPVQYTTIFTNILTELSLLVNSTEIIYSESSKALFKSTETESHRVSDLFK